MTTFEQYANTRGWRTTRELLPTEDGNTIEITTITKTIDNYAWWMTIPNADPPQVEWEFRIDFAEQGLQASRLRTVRPT